MRSRMQFFSAVLNIDHDKINRSTYCLIWYHAIVAKSKIQLHMLKQRIQLSFKKETDANFLTKSTHISTSMTDNPAFPDPVPPLASVQAAVSDYAQKLIAATGLGRTNVADKNQARQVLEDLLFQLGLYVMFAANGNVAALVSSGYTLTKEPQPRKLEAPGNVTLSNGISSGELVSGIAKGNASSFIHEITDVFAGEDTVWTSFATTTSQFTFTKLTPGRQYWVRIALVANRRQLAYSNVATQFATL